MRDCDGIENLPALTQLYLAENQIKTIKGLKDLPNLTRLHLRNNELSEFDEVPNLPKLEHLNLRETKIESIKEISKLRILQSLQKLNLLQTPITDEKADGIKKEVLLAIEGHKFKMINKEEIVKEDYEDAVALKE